MKFYRLTCTDYHRLCRSTRDTLVLRSDSWLIGQGPDCYYVYEHIVAAPDAAPADAGTNPTIDAAFGVGPEDRRLTTEELTPDQVSSGLYNGTRRCSISLPEGMDPTGLDTYGIYGDGGTAVWVTPTLVERLAVL